ncbi:CCA tRNA nucleotidyltransferase [Pseudoflavonifractor capillosus]|uniref:CCA tRNA nucleotidyltransferase n=1 Tax=Pseudoflavonifractor capillosus TaxID=106588 RepID=UPI00030C17FE|nr:tRNA nucleotidyltransferase [Pseudoflavonifractor capillosus]
MARPIPYDTIIDGGIGKHTGEKVSGVEIREIPGGVAALCARLRSAGWEAYPVGGCVRDLLLGRTPGDWDVTTSAMPEEVIALFDRTVPTGIRHGTVTVLTEDGGVEVTTFRAESGYADGRHPDAVTFGGDLTGDLTRRDFTINAMALGPDGAVIDPFGGQKDLQARLIRCVGEPGRRFREDALRMLRAVRFSAQLGFAVENATAEALRDNAELTACLSAERIRTELEKILLSQWPERGEGLFAWGLLAAFVGADAQPDLTTLHRVPARPLERWAALCALLLDEGSIRSAEEFLKDLRLDGRTVRACAAGAELVKTMPRGAAGWRHALAEHGADACTAAAAIGAAMMGGEYLRELAETLAEGSCLTVRELALSGAELAAMGYRGADIGAAQRRLLDHVLDHPEDNRPERLRELLN